MSGGTPVTKDTISPVPVETLKTGLHIKESKKEKKKLIKNTEEVSTMKLDEAILEKVHMNEDGVMTVPKKTKKKIIKFRRKKMVKFGQKGGKELVEGTASPLQMDKMDAKTEGNSVSGNIFCEERLLIAIFIIKMKIKVTTL